MSNEGYPVAGYVSNVTGFRVVPTGERDCLLGDEYDFYDRYNNQLHIWMRESADTVQLSIIGAVQKGTGIGTKFVNALKQYSDHSGKKLVIPETTPKSQPYWTKFKWLVSDYVPIDDCGKTYWAPNTFSYTPQKKTRTVYIAGMSEAVRDNPKRVEELVKLLRERGYGYTGCGRTAGGGYAGW